MKSTDIKGVLGSMYDPTEVEVVSLSVHTDTDITNPLSVVWCVGHAEEPLP